MSPDAATWSNVQLFRFVRRGVQELLPFPAILTGLTWSPHLSRNLAVCPNFVALPWRSESWVKKPPDPCETASPIPRIKRKKARSHEGRQRSKYMWYIDMGGRIPGRRPAPGSRCPCSSASFRILGARTRDHVSTRGFYCPQHSVPTGISAETGTSRSWFSQARGTGGLISTRQEEGGRGRNSSSREAQINS